MSRESIDRRALLALLLVVPAPSVGVIVALLVAPGIVGQSVYAFCKLWMIAVPLLWWLRVDRRPISWSPLRRGGLAFGALSGISIAGVVLGGYALLGERLIDPDLMREVAAGNGLNRKPVYLGLALQLTLVNALIEEYVWRWFVYRKCEALMPSGPAVVATAFLFSVHHAIALFAQFGPAVALLGSTGTFVGSLVWSWCYLRYGSIWPAYLSHMLIDVSVFVVGWSVLFG